MAFPRQFWMKIGPDPEASDAYMGTELRPEDEIEFENQVTDGGDRCVARFIRGKGNARQVLAFGGSADGKQHELVLTGGRREFAQLIEEVATAMQEMHFTCRLIGSHTDLTTGVFVSATFVVERPVAAFAGDTPPEA